MYNCFPFAVLFCAESVVFNGYSDVYECQRVIISFLLLISSTAHMRRVSAAVETSE